MKNITVSVDDEVYHRARVRAAELATSVSSVVGEFLDGFARKKTVADVRIDRLKALRAGTGFSVGKRMSREELHDRASLR